MQSFDEIRVYDGIAERTGVQFERSDVRHSGTCCSSWTQLVRKAGAFGDGTFYLPLKEWRGDQERVDLRKPWTVMS